MLCPRCYGKHLVMMNGARVPCPECAGVGELHCCDGLREQDCPIPPADQRPTPTTLNILRETQSLRNQE